MRRWATLPSRLTLLASAVCIFAAVVALYARSAILDDAPFADRAVATLAQDEVAEEIAQRFTDGVVERSPGLVTLRPALEAAAADVVAEPGFAAEFGAGMRALHRGVFTGSSARPRCGSREWRRRSGRRSRTARRCSPRACRATPTRRCCRSAGTARERVLLARPGAPTGRRAPRRSCSWLGLLGLLLVRPGASDRRRGLWAGGLALAGAGGALTARVDLAPAR